MATPAFVNSSQNANTGARTTITVTLGFTPVAGDLLVACISSDKNAGVYTVTGFAKAEAWASTSTSGGIFYKVSDGTETSVVFSQTVSSTNGLTAWVGEFSGVNTLDQHTYAGDETTVNARSTGTTGTTSTASELAIAVASLDTWGSVTGGHQWSGVTVANDTFTGSAGDLSGHTAETGGTWSETFEQTPGAGRGWLLTGSGQATPDKSGSGTNLYDSVYALTDVDFSDGYLQAYLPQGTTGSSWLVARQNPTTPGYHYWCKTLGTTLYVGRTNGSGSWTTIATATLVSGDYVRLEVFGSSPTRLRAKRASSFAALDTTNWQIDTTDNTSSHQIASGYIGICGEYDDDFGDYSGNVDDFTAVHHFAELAFPTTSSGGPPALSVGAKVFSATGTVETTWTYTGTADQVFAGVATFYGSSASEATRVMFPM